MSQPWALRHNPVGIETGDWPLPVPWPRPPESVQDFEDGAGPAMHPPLFFFVNFVAFCEIFSLSALLAPARFPSAYSRFNFTPVKSVLSVLIRGLKKFGVRPLGLPCLSSFPNIRVHPCFPFLGAPLPSSRLGGLFWGSGFDCGSAALGALCPSFLRFVSFCRNFQSPVRRLFI